MCYNIHFSSVKQTQKIGGHQLVVPVYMKVRFGECCSSTAWQPMVERWSIPIYTHPLPGACTRTNMAKADKYADSLNYEIK